MSDAVPLLSLLTGGDRRSIGRVPEVVAMVLSEPVLLAQLIAGMCHANPIVAMRASDAAEKVTAQHQAGLDLGDHRVGEFVLYSGGVYV